jgi:hypothetical protein
MEQVWGSGEVHTGFPWGKLGERDHLEDPGIDGRDVNGRIILRWIFKKWDGGGEFLDWMRNLRTAQFIQDTELIQPD